MTRRSVRRTGLLVAAALSVGAVAGGCTARSESATAPATSVRSAPTPPAVDCAGVRDDYPCRTISVGGTTYRYMVLESRGHGSPAAGSQGAGSSVLVDLGGPGLSVFSGSAAMDFAAGWPAGQRLLFVEEPWVTAPTSTACTSALSDLYASLRDPAEGSRESSADVASQLVDECALSTPGRWGWDDRRYADVVHAATAHEHLRVEGLVGTSFGARRVRAVWGDTGVRWVVLNSPAPVRLTGGQYLSARVTSAVQAMASACAACGPPARTQALMDRTVRDFAADPVTLSTRTPTVDGSDAAAAWLGAAYLPRPDRAQLFADVTQRPRDVADEVGRLSDSVLLRYGELDISPAALAYFDEVCRSYPGWEDPAGGGPEQQLLARLHSPCSRILPSASVQSRPRASAKVCVAHSTDDHVVPAQSTAQWLELVPQATEVVGSRQVHADPSLATACYAKLRATG